MSETPFDVKAAFREARTLAAARRDDEAEALLLKVLAVESGRLDALLEYGHVLRRREDPRTEDIFRKAWTLHPRSSKAGLWLSRLLQARGEIDEAEGVIESLLTVLPDQADLLLELGGVQRKAGDLAGAEATFRRMWAAHPGDIKGGLWLARVLTMARKADDAIEVYRQVLLLDPEHQDALIRLGGLLSDAALDDEALAVFETATGALEPTASAWLGLARAQARSVSIAIATATLREGVRRYPQSAGIRRALASQLLRTGLDQEAREVAAEGERRFADEPGFVNFLIDLDVATGRFDAAQARLSALPTDTQAQRLPVMRRRMLFERTRWRIDESIALSDQIVAMPEATAHDFSASAVARMIALDVTGARGRMRVAAQMRPGPQKNISQGLTGEILNDFWTDAAAVDAGRQARADTSTPAWLSAVSEFPNHTGCALAFLVHLRQTGQLDTRPPTPGAGAIPRHVHQFWDTTSPPDDVTALIATWEAGNPGWAHTLHSQTSATAYLKAEFGEEVLRAFRRCRTIAGKADLFRLALLYRQGGVYADADDRCVKPMEELTQGRDMVLRQEVLGSIGNNFLAARPGHPVIGVALDQAVEAVLRGDRDSVWLLSGPGLITRVLAAYLAADEARLGELGRSLVITDQHELRAFCVSACQATYKTSSKAWQRIEFGGVRGASLRPGAPPPIPLATAPAGVGVTEAGRPGRAAFLFGASPKPEEESQ